MAHGLLLVSARAEDWVRCSWLGLNRSEQVWVGLGSMQGNLGYRTGETAFGWVNTWVVKSGSHLSAGQPWGAHDWVRSATWQPGLGFAH